MLGGRTRGTRTSTAGRSGRPTPERKTIASEKTPEGTEASRTGEEPMDELKASEPREQASRRGQGTEGRPVEGADASVSSGPLDAVNSAEPDERPFRREPNEDGRIEADGVPTPNEPSARTRMESLWDRLGAPLSEDRMKALYPIGRNPVEHPIVAGEEDDGCPFVPGSYLYADPAMLPPSKPRQRPEKKSKRSKSAKKEKGKRSWEVRRRDGSRIHPFKPKLPPSRPPEGHPSGPVVSLTFGRHKGKSLDQIAREDLGYLLWIERERNFNRPEARAAVIRFLKTYRRPERIG